MTFLVVRIQSIEEGKRKSNVKIIEAVCEKEKVLH